MLCIFPILQNNEIWSCMYNIKKLPRAQSDEGQHRQGRQCRDLEGRRDQILALMDRTMASMPIWRLWARSRAHGVWAAETAVLIEIQHTGRSAQTVSHEKSCRTAALWLRVMAGKWVSTLRAEDMRQNPSLRTRCGIPNFKNLEGIPS